MPARQDSSTVPSPRGLVVRLHGAVAAGVVLVWTSGLLAAVSTQPVEAGFSFSKVVAEGRGLAAQPARKVATTLPSSLDRLNYDSYRDIRFRPSEALWGGADSRWSVQLFHLGLFFRQPVEINLVESGHVRRLPFSGRLFSYPKEMNPDTLPADLDFAGFRLHYPMNRPDYRDEVIAFLGASYFRAIARGQVYGASARGLAVDIASPRPEEFPTFTRFWLVQPAAEAEIASVYALLESPSVTGAYRFTVRPDLGSADRGSDTAVDVEAHVFARQPVEVLGVAPVTSMFLWGKANPSCNDYRPEVHDSDCLLLASDKDWILRPLTNPVRTSITRFPVQRLGGFGLLQRETHFDQYQDLEARYESRPSVWVEPDGDWGSGSVVLMETPVSREFDDNVNAFWVPDRPLRPGQELTLRYRLHFCGPRVPRHTQGQVIATRLVHQASTARFFVDFGGAALERLEASAPLQPVITATSGRISGVVLQRNPHNRTWRVFFDVAADGSEVVELRGLLRNGGSTLTETWSYPWRPS